MRFHARVRMALLGLGLIVAVPLQMAAQAAKAAPAAKATKATKAAAAGGPAKPADPAKIAEERKVADRLYENGRSEEAKAIYVRLAPFFSDDLLFNKRLAHCFYTSPKREMAQAARYYARAYELNPKDPEVEMNLGKAHSWGKQYNAAISIFQRILAHDRFNPEAWLELARAQNYVGQPQAARATYESYLEHYPGHRDVRLEFAAFLSWNKQPEIALQHYRYVLRADPNNLKARVGEAQVMAWQGKLKESLQAYNGVLRDAPNNDDALRGKAFVLLWLQRYEEAEKILAQVLRKKPADREIQDAMRQVALWRKEEPARRAQAELDALRQQADAAVAQNDFPRAIALLQEAIARAPQQERFRFRFRLGEVYAWQQQWPEAMETFQKLYAEQPDNLAALRELGNAQVAARRLEEAAATFRAYLQRSPEPGVRLDLARVLSWSGKLEEASSTYQQVLQGQPDNFEAGLGLAQALAWRGQHQQALEQFDALLRKRPGHREALLGKAQVLHWSGSIDKALAVLETMRETWPQDREIASVLQAVRDAEKQRALEAEVRRPVDIEERIRNYQEALARNPNSLQILQRLGELYASKKDFPQAISYYEQALAQKPADPTLQLSLAQLASWSRDFPRSIRLYEGLLTQAPEKHEYRVELARILSWSGRNAEAIAQYREVLKRHPDDKDARLGLARVLSWNKQLDEALEEYSRLLKADPGNRDALIERARVYSWKGETTAALNLYDELLIRTPEDRDARFGKAQTLYWSGRSREAKGILEDIQTKYPKDRDVALAAAGVHAALGRRDLALRALDDLDKMQPGNAEVERMRQSIRQDLRPIVILGFAPSVDSSDLKIYHSTATLSFSLTPQVRSYVFAGVIPSNDPGSGSETGREVLFGSYGRVNEWLLLRGEVGVNTATAGREGGIGGGGFTFFATPRMQFDFDVSRRYLNYIPRPIRLSISRVQLRGGWDWRPERRTAFHLDYYHQRYSDTNTNNGMNFTVLRNLVRNERVEFEAGYLYAVSGFSKDINSGFFAPSQFQRHAALGNLRAKLNPRAGFSFWGSLGREQVSEDPFRLDGTFRFAWDYSLADHFKFTVGYGYFAISSIARAGAYRTHSGYATLELRF